MWKFLISFSGILLIACGDGKAPAVRSDSSRDTVADVIVPQFDISGSVEVSLPHGKVEKTTNNGTETYVLHDAQDNDSLLIKYITPVQCEECRLETQIWRNEKYVELVRDTGYGLGDYTRIPISMLKRCSQDGSPDYQELSLYLSVHQYHPVETGNKRFLFYLRIE